MRARSGAWPSSCVVASVLLATGLIPVVSAQRSPSATPASAAWRMPRTADGRPDLQGFWTNDSYTPLERPAELKDKAVFTPEEALAWVRGRQDRLLAQSRDDIHYDDAIWQAETYQKEANRRTSLITDPPDGRLPPLSADGEQRRLALAEARRGRGATDSVQDRSLGERCVTWGNVGPPMVPPTYNANFQILRAGDVLAIRHEMMHDVRLIPLDGSPHAADGVRYLAGDARGRWEGDTLVVDTANFTDKTNFRGPPATTRQDITHSARLHVVERFTLVDAGTIRYVFTVDDPGTWARPWSGEMPLRRFDGPVYEYGCHEGNYGVANILKAARVQEAGGR